MTRQMTREELLIERAERDHWFARENAKLAAEAQATSTATMGAAQEARLIDRGLINWWN